MAQKNRYLFRGRISERKFRDLLRLFALDITADRAAELTGLHHNTTLALYRLLRLRMAEITSDGFPAYHGLVEAGFSRHHRIDKYADPNHPVFAEKGVHINGIESFWSYAKRRHQKFNGLQRDAFPFFLKETEFRFNNRANDLYKILLKSCRLTPLRSPQMW